jgi:site-specific recombinase XerD
LIPISVPLRIDCRSFVLVFVTYGAYRSAWRSGRGAAHLFRHGLATKMIRRGASLAEIAEVLRHRSQNATAIYSQVSFEALRTVAQPWPVNGLTVCRLGEYHRLSH